MYVVMFMWTDFDSSRAHVNWFENVWKLEGGGDCEGSPLKAHWTKQYWQSSFGKNPKGNASSLQEHGLHFVSSNRDCGGRAKTSLGLFVASSHAWEWVFYGQMTAWKESVFLHLRVLLVHKRHELPHSVRKLEEGRKSEEERKQKVNERVNSEELNEMRWYLLAACATNDPVANSWSHIRPNRSDPQTGSVEFIRDEKEAKKAGIRILFQNSLKDVIFQNDFPKMIPLFQKKDFSPKERPKFLSESFRLKMRTAEWSPRPKPQLCRTSFSRWIYFKTNVAFSTAYVAKKNGKKKNCAFGSNFLSAEVRKFGGDEAAWDSKE